MVYNTLVSLLGNTLGEYHKNETIKKTLLIYIDLLGHLQELHETEEI